MSHSDFSKLPLQPKLIQNLASLGYQQMTPIQAQSLPEVLAGKDVIAQAKTGSGKTAVFALGMLNRLQVKNFRPQALVLCPTRELADQVAKEIRRLARAIPNIKVLTLCGGMPLRPQADSLQHGAHIIVGTPGRVEDHLGKRTLDLRQLHTLVLDEADRMLDMGFEEAIDTIIDQTPRQRQTLLFSATYPEEIQAIARQIMHKPSMIQVEATHDQATIQQAFYWLARPQHRLQALQILLKHHRPNSTVVFCNTKIAVKEVASDLYEAGFSVIALHGDFEQRERDQKLVRFANKSASVLVATDVAARGLDIDALDAVINYDLSHDPEVHVHRIGRTGRAGSSGLALSLYTDKDQRKLSLLEEYMDTSIETLELPHQAVLEQAPLKAKMATLQIDGGKKQKVRPGDILGALTSKNGLTGQQVGKIHTFDHCSYVAVEYPVVKTALDKINQGKLKGRSFKVRWLRR